MIEKFVYFLKQADQAVAQLPHKQFHRMINRDLLGVYLADEKVNKQKSIKESAKQLLRLSGSSSSLFLWNAMIVAHLL